MRSVINSFLGLFLICLACEAWLPRSASAQEKYLVCLVRAKPLFSWSWTHRHRVGWCTNDEAIAWDKEARVKSGKIKKYAEGYAWAKWTWVPGRECYEGTFRSCVYARAKRWRAFAKYEGQDVSRRGSKKPRQPCPPTTDPCVCLSHLGTSLKVIGDPSKTSVQLEPGQGAASLDKSGLTNPCDRKTATLRVTIRDRSSNRIVADGMLCACLEFGQARPTLSARGLFSGAPFSVRDVGTAFEIDFPSIVRNFPGLALNDADVRVEVDVAGVDANRPQLVATDRGTTNGGLYAIDPFDDQQSSLTSIASPRPLDAMLAMPNGDYVVSRVDTGAGGSIERVSPTGAITTMVPGREASGLALDRDGTIVASGKDGLVRIDPFTNTVSSIRPSSTTYNGVAVDRSTGDYLVINWPDEVHRISPQGNLVTIEVDLGGSGIWGIDYDSDAQQTFLSSARGLLECQFGSHTTLTTLRANAIRVDPMNDVVAAVRSTGAVHLFNRAGTPIAGAVPQTHASSRWAGVDFTNRSTLTGQTMGNVNQLNLSLPTSAGLGYHVVLGFSGTQPGFPLKAGRTVPLNWDGLTFFTATFGDVPGITTGLRGFLDERGRASATITATAPVLRGMRIYAVAISPNPSHPAGIDFTPATTVDLQ